MCNAMKSNVATLSYVTALCIYGTIGWAVHYIDLPSEVVVLLRGLIGVAFIALVTRIAKGRIDTAAIRSNFGWLAASGIFLGLNWVFLFAAFRATTVAVATLFNYMAPIILIVIAPIVLREPRSMKKLACAAVALIGVVFVSGLPESGFEGVNALGIGLALAGAMCFVGVVLCNKRMGRVAAFERAMMQLAFASLAALPFVLVNNWGATFSPNTLTIVLVIVLGVVHTGVAYCLYFYAFDKLSAQTIAVLGYVEPGVSVLVSAFALGEPLTILGWIGAVLIIGAAASSEVVG